MARQWRIEFPGAIYHVISRGNGGQDIFLTDDDRAMFLGLLEELSERFSIEIYAYVLMGNHYHILLKTIESNLSKAMQWFGTTYTRKFNLNNHINGHLFQGRFKSIIVENDAYLMRLSCYIHRNPLRAGIVDRLAEYKWSSYLFYGYKKESPDWLKTSNILDCLSKSDPHKAYRKKMQEYAKENQSIWEDVKHGLIYGSQDFVKKLKDQYLSKEKNNELPQYNSLFREFVPEDLFVKGAEALNLDIDLVRNNRKRLRGEEKEKRDLLIYLLWKTGQLSSQEIGSLFGLTYSMISRCVKTTNERILSDQGFRKQYQTISTDFKV